MFCIETRMGEGGEVRRAPHMVAKATTDWLPGAALWRASAHEELEKRMPEKSRALDGSDVGAADV
jgi:hypothetical protein